MQKYKISVKDDRDLTFRDLQFIDHDGNKHERIFDSLASAASYLYFRCNVPIAEVVVDQAYSSIYPKTLKYKVETTK